MTCFEAVPHGVEGIGVGVVITVAKESILDHWNDWVHFWVRLGSLDHVRVV
jgi:hypothetical protein